MKNEKITSLLAMKFLSFAGLGFIGFPGIIISLIIPGLLSIFIPADYRFIILTSLTLLLLLLSVKLMISAVEELNKESVLVDKTISFMLMLIFCPFTDDWIWMIISVVVFLIFHQMELFPYRLISGKPGFVGILGDDAITGIYATLTMHLFYSAFQVIGLIKTLGMKY
jgi:phosphatidylglycerophosphatase A